MRLGYCTWPQLKINRYIAIVFQLQFNTCERPTTRTSSSDNAFATRHTQKFNRTGYSVIDSKRTNEGSLKLGVAGNTIYRKYQFCLHSFCGISYTLQSILPSWRRMSAIRIKCMQVFCNHERTVRNKQGQRSTHVITTHIIRAHLKIPPSLSLFTDTIKTRKMQKKKAMYTYYLQNCLNDYASKDLLHHFIASSFTVIHEREVLHSR